MRIIKVDISQINYQYRDYDQNLYDSVMRIGFSFPIQLIIKDNKYICLDGHKRLSVLQDILEKNPQYKRGSQVYVLIKNNDNIRSNDCWRGRNSH